MAYMCECCHEIYITPLQFCPKATCHCCDVVEIDDLMLPTILTLNDKGYCTEFCCSGHYYAGASYPYVALNQFMNEIFEDGEVEDTFKNLPEPWYLDIDNRICLRCKIDDNDEDVRYKRIIHANLVLMEFVKTLPDLEY